MLDTRFLRSIPFREIVLYQKKIVMRIDLLLIAFTFRIAICETRLKLQQLNLTESWLLGSSIGRHSKRSPIVIYNDMNFVFYSEVMINRRTFPIVLDTGSSDFFVTSATGRTNVK